MRIIDQRTRHACERKRLSYILLERFFVIKNVLPVIALGGSECLSIAIHVCVFEMGLRHFGLCAAQMNDINSIGFSKFLHHGTISLS